ncbi:MAG: hypothetical protein KGD73_01670 [Candidatus Lokiarchaeota archaeon]|nr:hypothetical protein [Candidatus Lokiarchaeota archaeon]
MTLNNIEDELDNLAKIHVICPHCKKSKFIKIPANIIHESNNVTTISIPLNHMCEHSFQVFVDKQFAVRGYQRVDFDISNFEIYSDSKGEDLLITYNLSVIIKRIVQFVRQNIKIKGIFGGLVLTESGNLIFSSLPGEISLTMIRKMELQKSFPTTVNQIFLILSNNQKIISSMIVIENVKLIITLCFSAEMDYNTANYYMLELKKNILLSSTIDSSQTIYWLYSIISQSIDSESEEFLLDSIGIKIQKSVVTNINEIEEILKTKDYEGKVFINERYVRMMEGLMWTLNDALLIISNLNMF